MNSYYGLGYNLSRYSSKHVEPLFICKEVIETDDNGYLMKKKICVKPRYNYYY